MGGGGREEVEDVWVDEKVEGVLEEQVKEEEVQDVEEATRKCLK